MIRELPINKGRVWALDFNRWSGGWTCSIYYTLTVVEQFSDQTRTVNASGRFWWLAYWRARRLYKRDCRKSRARPGQRSEKGWN